MFDLKMKILIVDDMFAMRKLVTKICKDIGFTNLAEAADGALAWQAITDANPAFELVISDWSMPNMTGIELLKKVRADAKTKELPFLMVTAEAEKKQVGAAVMAGVTNYVVKPFTKDTLKEKLEQMHAKLTQKKSA